MNGTRPDKSRLYYPEMRANWWLKRPGYILFMLREWSSLFIALFLVVFLVQSYQLSSGPEAYTAFAQKLRSPGWVIFHIVALLFSLYHSVTWFYSSAIVMPLRIGEWLVPRKLVVGLNLLVLVVVSIVILALFIKLHG